MSPEEIPKTTDTIQTPRDVLFFAAGCSFIAGTVFGGLGITLVVSIILITIILAISLLVIFLCMFYMKDFVNLSYEWVRMRPAIILIIAGSFLMGHIYYVVDDYNYTLSQSTVERITDFEGKIINEPLRGLKTQTVRVALKSSEKDTENIMKGQQVSIKTDLYPELSYGDVVQISGDIVPVPRDSYGNYLMKEGVHGSLFYPEIHVVRNEGNPILKTLFTIRRFMKSHISRLFGQQHAAFLSGILLGDKEEFSPEFLKKLSASGTMHLVALSGMNIMIITLIIIALFSKIFREKKRSQLIATFLTVALFVAMTGFQVSAIRAALMAFLIAFAKMTHRIYRPHNAIAFIALIITLWNPKAPVFDLGFQLSFLATLAIIYLAPLLRLIPFLKKNGFLEWREITAMTAAAVLGVAPITIINFENFSFTALFANIGILAAILPMTITGFLSLFLSMTFPSLAFLMVQPTAFLADYVMYLIETFAVLYVPFNPEIGFAFAVVYYCIMVSVCYQWSPACKNKASIQLTPTAPERYEQ